MIDNETVRKASEIGIIDVVDAIKLIETNPAYITLTFDEKINMVIGFVYQQRYNETVRRLKKSAKLRYVDADLRDIHYTDNRSIYKSQDNLTNLLQLSVLNFFRIKFIFDSIRWTINIK